MQHTNITLRIETRTVLRLLTIITLFGLLVLAVFKLSDILIIFAISFFLAIVLNPPVSWLSSLLPKHNRIAASAIAYIVVLAVLGVIAYIAVPPVVNQTTSFVDNFPSYVRDLSENRNSLSGVIERYGLQDEIDRGLEQVKQEAGTLAQGVGSTFVSGVSTFLTGTITLLTVLVLTFLMLIEGPSWVKKLWSLDSNKRRLQRDKRLMASMYRVVSGYVNGQVLVAAIGAASVFVVLFVLTRIFAEVPLSAILPLTGIAFISALIPMFGSTIAAIAITLVLLLNSIPAAVIFLVFFIVYQQIENNVIQPVIQSKTIQLSALGVFAAAIIGIALLGIVGAIMAIPIAGCIRVLVLDFMNHREDYTHHTPDDSKLVTVGSKQKS